jgi:hypothetical protein
MQSSWPDSYATPTKRKPLPPDHPSASHNHDRSLSKTPSAHSTVDSPLLASRMRLLEFDPECRLE